MITNPSHQTDSRRAAKNVDICYIGYHTFADLPTHFRAKNRGLNYNCTLFIQQGYSLVQCAAPKTHLVSVIQLCYTSSIQCNEKVTEMHRIEKQQAQEKARFILQQIVRKCLAYSLSTFYCSTIYPKPSKIIVNFFYHKKW